MYARIRIYLDTFLYLLYILSKSFHFEQLIQVGYNTVIKCSYFSQNQIW